MGLPYFDTFALVSTVEAPEGLGVWPGFLSRSSLEREREDFAWEQGSLLCRRYVWYFGSFGAATHAQPLAWMRTCAEQLMARGAISWVPNQFRLCNWADAHPDALRWHIDAPQCGEEIAIVSLSDARAIGFRRPAFPEQIYVLSLSVGDVYTLCGDARYGWEHRVLRGGQSLVLSQNTPLRAR